MRILQLVHQYPPEFVGGSELYTQALGRALVARGHTVGVFTRTYAGAPGLARAAADGMSIFRAGDGPAGATRRFADGFRNPALLAHWQAALDAFAPDAVLVQHLLGLPVACLSALRARNIPYIITLLDYWWMCANANLLTNYAEHACDGPRAYLNCAHCAVARTGTAAAWPAAPAAAAALAWRAARLRTAMAGARLLVTPSDFVTQWHRAHGAPALVQTVRWGVMPPPGGLPAHEPPAPGEPLRLLYVGGIAPNKGLHVALQALQQLRGAWRLRVVGDLTQHPAHVAQLRALAGSQVEFCGPLGREAVWHALAASDIALVPSLWHETFCLAAHEAVAAGAVPFVSNMGALRELVTDGVNGRLLPPGDVAAWAAALQQAIDDRPALEAQRRALPAPRLFAHHVDDLTELHARVLGAVAAATATESAGSEVRP